MSQITHTEFFVSFREDKPYFKYNYSDHWSCVWDFNSVIIGTTRFVSDTGFRNACDELFVWNKALTDAEMVDVTSYDTFEEMALGQQFTIQ